MLLFLALQAAAPPLRIAAFSGVFLVVVSHPAAPDPRIDETSIL